MTLDELITECIKDKMCGEKPAVECMIENCHKCEYRVDISFEEILPVLLETKKELETYKTALGLACDDIFHSDMLCDIDCKLSDNKCCAECFYNHYLHKARE